MRLREIREAKDITQYRMAKDLGIDRSQLCRWEKGKAKPSLEALGKLADYLGCSTDELLGRVKARAV